MMAAERPKRNYRPGWDELSPALRAAVERVRNDPPPDELTRRALVLARRQAARYSRKLERRRFSWFAAIIAASLAVAISIGTMDHRFVNSPPSTPREDIATALSDDSPSVWAYSRAARKSPDALYALLDRQSHEARLFDGKFACSFESDR
jgi:hypothetical protein